MRKHMVAQGADPCQGPTAAELAAVRSVPRSAWAPFAPLWASTAMRMQADETFSPPGCLLLASHEDYRIAQLGGLESPTARSAEPTPCELFERELAARMFERALEAAEQTGAPGWLSRRALRGALRARALPALLRSLHD
ncbi:MAG: hypothetical protein ACR2LV_05020 [Solirubrobacteraceae bacterium]